MDFFSKGLKNEFETAVVNEPSVFEPLKFYCIYFSSAAFTTFVRRVMTDQTVGVNSISGKGINFKCLRAKWTVEVFS